MFLQGIRCLSIVAALVTATTSAAHPLSEGEPLQLRRFTSELAPQERLAVELRGPSGCSQTEYRVSENLLWTTGRWQVIVVPLQSDRCQPQFVLTLDFAPGKPNGSQIELTLPRDVEVSPSVITLPVSLEQARAAVRAQTGEDLEFNSHSKRGYIFGSTIAQANCDWVRLYEVNGFDSTVQLVDDSCR